MASLDDDFLLDLHAPMTDRLLLPQMTAHAREKVNLDGVSHFIVCLAIGELARLWIRRSVQA
jgi:hypothetical protein